MNMTITVKSGMSADGFDIEVSNLGNSVVKESYAYGYNASWYDGVVEEHKPYVVDIIKDYMQKYGISVDNIKVVAGRNVFTNESVSEKDVQSFKNKYISDLIYW